MLGECSLQFAKYHGQSFRWMLENARLSWLVCWYHLQWNGNQPYHTGKSKQSCFDEVCGVLQIGLIVMFVPLKKIKSEGWLRGQKQSSSINNQAKPKLYIKLTCLFTCSWSGVWTHKHWEIVVQGCFNYRSSLYHQEKETSDTFNHCDFYIFIVKYSRCRW